MYRSREGTGYLVHTLTEGIGGTRNDFYCTYEPDDDVPVPITGEKRHCKKRLVSFRMRSEGESDRFFLVMYYVEFVAYPLVYLFWL